jgi:hypothetical protein
MPPGSPHALLEAHPGQSGQFSCRMVTITKSMRSLLVVCGGTGLLPLAAHEGRRDQGVGPHFALSARGPQGYQYAPPVIGCLCFDNRNRFGCECGAQHNEVSSCWARLRCCT